MRKIGLGILASSLLAISLTACSQSSTNGSQAQETSNGQDASTGNQTSSGTKKTIVYQVRTADDRLKETIKKYEANHPNIEIQLETAPPMTEDPKTPKDFMDYLNKFDTTLETALMAGKGPDMVEIANVVPLKYAKHNFFVDLGAMMDQDGAFKKEDYFSNILSNAKDSNGKLSSMPLGFSLITFIGDRDAIDQTGVKFDDKTWTWKDFLNTANQLIAAKGKYSSVLGDSPVNVLNAIVDANPSFIMDVSTKKARFDSPEFKDLFKQIKDMNDSKILGGFPQQSYFANRADVNSPGDYLKISNVYYPNGKLYTYPHPEGKTGGYFQTNRNVSITTNSKVKPEAWDFLKFMMSEQVNIVDNVTEGIPINKKGLANQLAKLKSDGTFEMQGQNAKVDTAKLDEFESLVNKAVLHFEPDSFIRDLSFKEFEAVFSKQQKSMDAVIKVLQDKVTTYLNE